MADERLREKTIKGLTRIESLVILGGEIVSERAKGEAVECLDQAIAMLRAEAPRIITAEDFKENPMVDEHGFLPAWCECDEVETERGELVGVISKGETLDGWTEVSLDDMPGRPGHNPHVRYWTGRPGKELMGKVKWG